MATAALLKYYVKFKAEGIQQEFRSQTGGNRMSAGVSGPGNFYGGGIKTWRFDMLVMVMRPKLTPHYK